MPKITDKYIKFGGSTQETNDGDLPSIYLSPINFVPTQVDSEGIDKVSAYLKGIDITLGEISTGNIDGGSPSSNYGGILNIDGGAP